MPELDTLFLIDSDCTFVRDSDLGPTDFEVLLTNQRRNPLGGKGVMRSDYPKRLVRWGLGVVMLLSIHEFCAPRVARAGCSHLVVSRSDRLLGLHRLGASVGGDLSIVVSDEWIRESSPQQGPKRRSTCSGPSCSDRIPSPVSTSSEGSEGPHQWGALNTVVPDQMVAPPDKTIDEPVLRSIGLKPSIFHPPPA